jgi:hypothetical protein
LERKSEGHSVSEAPSIFDGGKPNSVSRISSGGDHLSHLDFSKCPASPDSAVINRRYSQHRNATIPEGNADRLSSFCFVLHRMGFFLPRELLRAR